MSGWYCATTVLSLMCHKKSKNVKHIYNYIYIYMFLHLLKFNFGPTHPRRTNFRRTCYTPPWLLPQNSWRSSWSLYLRRQARVKQPRNARQNAGNSFSVRKTIELSVLGCLTARSATHKMSIYLLLILQPKHPVLDTSRLSPNKGRL